MVMWELVMRKAEHKRVCTHGASELVNWSLHCAVNYFNLCSFSFNHERSVTTQPLLQLTLTQEKSSNHGGVNYTFA